MTLAAFSGPAFGRPPSTQVLAALRAAKPDLLLLLGDIGDDVATARATLSVLGGLPPPTVLIAGGRDTPARITDALSALGPLRDRVVDVTALHSIRIHNDTFVPVAGAADGRGALEKAACGYGLADLKDLAAGLGSGSRRWLLAWQAPSSGAHGVARTQEGLDLGSPMLAELAKRVGAAGGLFAWPHAQVLRPAVGGGARRVGPRTPSHDFQIVVPRISGSSMERSDGSRALPGFALLRLADDGLQLVESVAATE